MLSRVFSRMNRSSLISLLWAAMQVVGCSHSVAQNAAAPPPPPIEYVDTWGSHGQGPGELAAPVGMASDGESIIYIADASSGYVHKFSASGEPRLSFQDDRMNLQPADIAVDAGAAIYVADPRHSTVVIFFSDGIHHRQLRASALAGARESMHIGVDSYGTIYVTAKRPFGVRRFSPALRLIGSWGSGAARETAIENPSGLAVGPDGLVYVSEAESPQIKVYDASGTPQRTLSAPPEASDARFSGIAVNGKSIFAIGAAQPLLYIWGLDGTYRMTQDLSPWIPSAANTVARKIVVTPHADLLVLDPAAVRVFRFRLHL
jgi:hypothetical protein